tara:strand:- start:996 stop:1598 length:603 start_codon:yes stop_codon:yes gene_type:complete
LKRPRHSQSAHNSKSPSTLRLIGGKWRGRKLNFPAVEGLRPTGDRIRETLFNWLMADLPGARCLDAFSGSGALGLEALSRGAQAATLVEMNPVAARQLQDNLKLLQCEQAEVINDSCLNWLARAPENAFDVVFLDPPFQQNLWHETIALLDQRQWLKPEAAIYIETPRKLALEVPQSWQLHREKHAGDVSYRLYYRQQPD